MKATWNKQVIADSDSTIIIEGNHYFPPDSVNVDLLQPSELTTTCHWKGLANYYTLVDGDQQAADAAWYYAQPLDGATERVGQDFSDT